MDAIASFLVTAPAVEALNPGDKTKGKTAAGAKTASATGNKKL
jgi:hypothetical protein